MDKQDLREQSDNELSLVVFNDEYLYSMRNRLDIQEILDSQFLYTDEQFDELLKDLEYENDW